MDERRTEIDFFLQVGMKDNIRGRYIQYNNFGNNIFKPMIIKTIECLNLILVEKRKGYKTITPY